MNKTPFDQPSNSEDDLLPQYRFDYKKAKPNSFTKGTLSGTAEPKIHMPNLEPSKKVGIKALKLRAFQSFCNLKVIATPIIVMPGAKQYDI